MRFPPGLILSRPPQAVVSKGAPECLGRPPQTKPALSRNSRLAIGTMPTTFFFVTTR